MAEIHVRAGAGGEGGTVPTLRAAVQLARAGDVVVVHEGVGGLVYREQLAPPARTTWVAAEGERPVIGGGWDGSKEAGNDVAQVLIAAEDVVVDGLVIRNTRGKGIGVGKGGHGAIIRNCSTDRTFGGGIILNAAGEVLRDVLVTGNAITRAGMSWAAGVRPIVSGSLNLIRCVNALVEYNVVAYGHGEGVNIGKGSAGCTVRHNVIFDNSHLCLYFNRCEDCTAEGNLVFLTGFEERQVGKANWPSGIVFGDEVGANANAFPHSRGNRALGNVVVNCGTLIGVRNNAEDDGYDTQLDADTLIAGNTLIGGPLTTRGIIITENKQGRPHGAAIIRGNVIHMGQAAAGAEIAAAGSAAIIWQRNAWSQPPPAGCRSGDDLAAEGLVNPGAALANQFPAAGHNATLDNYRPRAGSPLAAAGVGALEPVGEEPPPEPEPVDWAALAALSDVVGVELVGVVAGLARAGDALQSLRDLIEGYRAAAEGGKE